MPTIGTRFRAIGEQSHRDCTGTKKRTTIEMNTTMPLLMWGHVRRISSRSTWMAVP